jgi:PIN domain nuclease of toxin-antitoxin system
MSSLLLDTCALLWIASGEEISADARTAIAREALHVSPISAWEIANLVRKNCIALTMPMTGSFQRAIEQMQAAVLPLCVEILIESCLLPAMSAGDPADRIIIGSARDRNLTVLTRDKAISEILQGRPCSRDALLRGRRAVNSLRAACLSSTLE